MVADFPKLHDSVVQTHHSSASDVTKIAVEIEFTVGFLCLLTPSFRCFQ